MSMVLAACSSVPATNHEIPPTTHVRHSVAAVALQQVGDPYELNMAGPKAFDATGLTYYAYRSAGATLPRGLQGQLDSGKPIDLATAEPGDLLFFQIDTGNGHHRLTVGLFTDRGTMVIARPGDKEHAKVTLVDINQDYWQQRLIGVVRSLPPAGTRAQ